VTEDGRDVRASSSIEECPECGRGPVAVVLVGSRWECYYCRTTVRTKTTAEEAEGQK
jgi:hypothetical protein